MTQDIRIIAGITNNTKPWIVVVLLFMSDLAGYYLSYYSAVVLRRLLIPWIGGRVSWNFNLPVMYLGFAFVLIIFSFYRLYPGYGLTAVKEIERIFNTLTLVYGSLGVIVYFLKVNTDFPRSVFIFSWMFGVVIIPLFRIILRNRISLFGWYGKPVLFILDNAGNNAALESLIRSRRMGLKPVALFVPENEGNQSELLGVPVANSIDDLINIREKIKIETVLLTSDPYLGAQGEQIRLIQKLSGDFKSIVLVSANFEFGSIWVKALDLEGYLGLEIQYNLIFPGKILIKRIIDVVGSLLLLIATLPISAIISLIIKLGSRGPVFYQHKRVGKDGTHFDMLKFRTMVRNADEKLADYLENDPKAKKEWELYQKLRKDPRITQFGRWLRKFSLDEIPQFWNVFRGDMSLMGPRAVTDDEVLKYGDYASLILRVKPGITGWWQVMGRNDTTWEQRIRLEVYYVSNWSLLMDAYITAKTVWVIISGQGR